MKTLLYVFSFVWIFLGLGTLVGGQQFVMGSLQVGVPSPSGGAVHDTAVAGWFWVWTFLMPSLLAGALGALLGRLDEVREAIDFANEQHAPSGRNTEQEERVDPYIGEGWLPAQQDIKNPAPSLLDKHDVHNQ
jgi:hypothetical protein